MNHMDPYRTEAEAFFDTETHTHHRRPCEDRDKIEVMRPHVKEC